MPTKELYTQKFENTDAQGVADLIFEECVGEGRMKGMIYEEERLKEGQRHREGQAKEEEKATNTKEGVETGV
jgi:hypothetical protein